MRGSSSGRRTPAMLLGFLRSGIAAATLAVLPVLAPGYLAVDSARADDETVPMQFTIVASGKDCGGCVVINAKGEFTDDTSRNFAIFIAESRLRGLLPKEPKRNQPRPPNGTRVFVGFESIGGKVIPALERALTLAQGSLDHEREVLADCGNMSAPTVLFVLERVLRAGIPKRLLMTAMGPGFTASCVSLKGAA